MPDRALALVRHELAAIQRGENSGLKRLRPDHCQAIAMYCDGRSVKDIASTLDRSEGWVRSAISDPLSRPIIDGLMSQLDLEFKGMYYLVIDKVRRALNDSDVEIALKGVDTWLKVHGKYKSQGDGARPLTAEDIVAKLLESAKQGGAASVTVSVGNPVGPTPEQSDPEMTRFIDVGEEEEPSL